MSAKGRRTPEVACRDNNSPCHTRVRSCECRLKQCDGLGRGGEGILGAMGLVGLRGAEAPMGPQEELQDLQAHAAGGDSFAMVELGNWLVHGDMVPQNYEQVGDSSRG